MRTTGRIFLAGIRKLCLAFGIWRSVVLLNMMPLMIKQNRKVLGVFYVLMNGFGIAVSDSIMLPEFSLLENMNVYSL